MNGCAISSGPLSVRRAAVDGHEFVEHPDDPLARPRQAHRDLQAFPIPFVDDRQQLDASAVVERLAHEVEAQVRCRTGGAVSGCRTPRGTRRLVRRGRFRRSAQYMRCSACGSTAGLPRAAGRSIFRSPTAGNGPPRRSGPRSPRRPVDSPAPEAGSTPPATGPPHRHPVITDQQGDPLSLRGRPYNFRARTSLMAAFSSARSAYIRFSLACSASRSRNRVTSETLAPPYLLRHVKKVARLIPCVRGGR